MGVRVRVQPVSVPSSISLTLQLVSLFILSSKWSFGWEICCPSLRLHSDVDVGADATTIVCPNENLCCGSGTGGHCLSGNRGSAEASTCCVDSSGTTTGCGEGFVCGSNHKTNKSICVLADKERDDLPEILPRNVLCKVTPNMTFTHGLPMTRDDFDSQTQSQSHSSPTSGEPVPVPVAAYLSTHGAIHEPQAVFSNVQQVVILVHGSSRNADDYICCTSAAIPLGSDPESILILAPWFLAPEDGPVHLTATESQKRNYNAQLTALRWNATTVNVQHTWRYGAQSILDQDLQFSSFDVVDRLVEQHLFDPTKFPSLQQIVVTGHSAGGQFVQRWALLSPLQIQSRAQTEKSASTGSWVVPVRIVVANPKSYAYLDPRRWVEQASNRVLGNRKDVMQHLEFRIPNDRVITVLCPSYNEWLWGLDNSTRLDVPYMYNAIAVAGSVDAVVQRYAKREVIYLSGDKDLLFNGDCEANQQGANRWERSQRFFASLGQVYGNHTGLSEKRRQGHIHRRWIVPNVNHDHCLMYQSRQGHLALFGWSLTREHHYYPMTERNAKRKGKRINAR